MKIVNIPKVVLILISIVLLIFSDSVELLILLALIFVFLYFKNKEYTNSAYYQITHYPQYALQFDKGRCGEYLIYKYLKGYEINGAMFLFNVYVPKENGETSEIDVIMIHHKGIFVFESKNFSGWIFGSETQRMWTQTLPNGRERSQKASFYNPIMQNETHIKNLEEFVGRSLPTKSIIVFSERCELKKVQVESSNIHVIRRNQVINTVDNICASIQKEVLSTEEIYEIYNCLYPLTQTGEETKKQHINNIRSSGKIHKEKNSVRKDNIVMFPQKQSSELIRNKTISTQVEAANADTQTIVSSELDIDEASKMVKNEKSLKCPRCGGDLILRTAKKGTKTGQQFYGCSNYPKCRYVHNI